MPGYIWCPPAIPRANPRGPRPRCTTPPNGAAGSDTRAPGRPRELSTSAEFWIWPLSRDRYWPGAVCGLRGWISGCSRQPVSQESSLSLSQASRCLSCPPGHGLEVLLPHLAGVIVEGAEPVGELLCIRARAQAGEVPCPARDRMACAERTFAGQGAGWPGTWACRRAGRCCCGWSWPSRTRRRAPHRPAAGRSLARTVPRGSGSGIR